MMSSETRKQYPKEFRTQAVELFRTGKPVSELAEELCVSTDLLYRGKHDLRALQRENAQLRMENGISKRPELSSGQTARTTPRNDRSDPPDTLWADDITFIPTTEGWLYLAVVIDLSSRRIVGWSTADNLRAELVADAFQKAVKSRRPKPGLIFHGDRGSQYGSKLFRGQLEKAEALQSMSAKSNPYDNAWTEPTAGRSTAADCLKGENSESIFYRKTQSRDASGRMLH